MLLRKMIRDMKNNKTQFFSIFLMAFLGVLIYSGIGGEWYGFQTTVDRYYEDYNLGDAWLYGDNFTENDLAEVRSVDGVTEAGRRLTLRAVGDFENNPELELLILEDNKISKPLVLEGEPFDPDKDGVWLAQPFAEKKGLTTGDILRFFAEGLSFEKEILGIILHPEYVYSCGSNDMLPNYDNFSCAVLGKAAFPKNIPIVYNQMVIKADKNKQGGLEAVLEEKLGGKYQIFLNRDTLVSYQMFENEIEQHRTMAEIFPAAFIAIALLTILTTMTRIVNSQRMQIGTLKALGFGRRRIIRHYVFYGFSLSFAGAVLGAVLGPLSLPYLFLPSMTGTYILPPFRAAVQPASIIMVILTVSACTLITYTACAKVLKEHPALALRPKAPKAVKRMWIEKTGIWRRAGFNVQWNVRDIVRNKIRGVMAVTGVTGCMGLLICALGMKDSMRDVNQWKYEELAGYRYKMNLTAGLPLTQAETLAAEYGGEMIEELAVEIKAGSRKKTGTLTIREEDAVLLRYQDAGRNDISLPAEGIALSHKMAVLLAVSAGDEIKWHCYGDTGWRSGRVEKIYRDPTIQGITLSRDYYENLGSAFLPTSVLCTEEVGGVPDGVDSVWDIQGLMESYDAMTEALNIMVYLLIAGAVLMAVIVLYNLGVLSFTERLRETATLKVIGFRTKRIRKLLLSQNLWLTVIGLLPGFFFGKWLIDFMMTTLGEGFDMMNRIQAGSIVISIAVTVLTSLAVNLFFTGRIKKLDMVSSLKGVE